MQSLISSVGPEQYRLLLLPHFRQVFDQFIIGGEFLEKFADLVLIRWEVDFRAGPDKVD